MSRNCKFITLGCKVNQYETQALRELVLTQGYSESLQDTTDLFVINTCAVTSTSEEKSRQYIRKAIRENPNARVIVTGCYAASNPEELNAIDGVDEVVEKTFLVERLQEKEGRGSIFDLKISRFEGHTRAFMKIEEGCDAFCSYCIIPYVRGRVESRPIEDIRAEAERLVNAGYKEIVLTGIHLGAYGRETRQKGVGLPGSGLLKVLSVLEEIPGLERIRLSSLEATEVAEELIGLMASSRKLCPHLHLPLQSGDDRVLEKMNRQYTAAEYMETIQKIRSRIENPSFSTDVMVGFPGETPEQFQNTLRVCEEAGFSRIHIFPYSPRRGTHAADMDGRIGPKELRAREKALKTLAQELALKYKKPFVGQDMDILVEANHNNHKNLLTGYSERYVKAVFPGPKDLKNTFVRVKVKRALPEYVEGELKD